MAVNDHGLEAIRKSAEEITPGDKSEYRIRTTASGEFRITGLTESGLDTEVILNDSGWVAIPSTPKEGRNSIRIQNQSDVEIKTNFSNSVGYVGVIIPAGASDFLDITDDIIIYGRSSSGNATVLVREIK